MPYPQELFDSALALYRINPETQATLRRAVSTAYYALFHFLIEEACKNWARPEQRPAITRVFEHKRMFDASNSRVAKYKNAAGGSAEFHLYSVAYAFCQLQQKRHQADYDLSSTWATSSVKLALGSVADAFASWSAIQHEQIAQDYLFSLLFKER
jgi:hypothetical protein